MQDNLLREELEGREPHATVEVVPPLAPEPEAASGRIEGDGNAHGRSAATRFRLPWDPGVGMEAQ
jgi:hypothetical protein